MPADRRRPRLGYLLAAVAAAMFAVNGSIAKFLLEDGVSAAHLSQLRVTVFFALLAGALALVDRARRPLVRRVHHARLGPRLRDAVLAAREPAVDVPVRRPGERA